MSQQSKFTKGRVFWGTEDGETIVYTGPRYAPAVIATFGQPSAESDAKLLSVAYDTAQILERFGYEPIKLIQDLPKIINMIIWDRSYGRTIEGIDHKQYDTMLFDHFLQHSLKGKWNWMPGCHFVHPEFPKNEREEYIADADGTMSAFDVWDEYIEDADSGRWIKITRRSYAYDLTPEAVAHVQQIAFLHVSIAEQTEERDRLVNKLKALKAKMQEQECE